MENNKLISMVAFVLEHHKNNDNEDWVVLELISNYAKFLSTPLALGQFVPCTLDNVPLEEVKWEYVKSLPLTSEGVDGKFYRLKNEYKEACDRVLFEGVKIIRKDRFEWQIKIADFSIITFGEIPRLTFYGTTYNENSTIESLLRSPNLVQQLTLTPSALKEIFK